MLMHLNTRLYTVSHRFSEISILHAQIQGSSSDLRDGLAANGWHAASSTQVEVRMFLRGGFRLNGKRATRVRRLRAEDSDGMA